VSFEQIGAEQPPTRPATEKKKKERESGARSSSLLRADRSRGFADESEGGREGERSVHAQKKDRMMNEPNNRVDQEEEREKVADGHRRPAPAAAAPARGRQ